MEKNLPQLVRCLREREQTLLNHTPTWQRSSLPAIVTFEAGNWLKFVYFKKNHGILGIRQIGRFPWLPPVTQTSLQGLGYLRRDQEGTPCFRPRRRDNSSLLGW